ncbi:G-protein coupled receptor 4-like isoform X3 [Dicentrarchus labrax]|uniref:G-protein coupled receptor 4-like isoform X3 n=1 Tax=Dicentrarchus labrax TaxID=13489 RepID=UPI0021F5C05F|nr:G-protein coupled receptor 4-like isoform X3 [Dicentrarchus labrax]
MEDFYINNTSLANSYNYSNITSNNEDNKEVNFNLRVIFYIIICIGLLFTLMAIYALYSQVRNDHVAPIYVINLFISDLIQLCYLIVWVALRGDQKIVQILELIAGCCLLASVGFMVCIALERYLVIAFPLWYRFRRTIKTSVVVCVVVWVIPLFVKLPFIFLDDFNVKFIIFGVFLLFPFPLLIFFLGGTLKALSASRVPSDEKRRIVGVLVLVLLIYTLLFLPSIIRSLTEETRRCFTLNIVSSVFLCLNPFADAVLYVFMRKGTIDKLLASVCCCRMNSNDISSSSV